MAALGAATARADGAGLIVMASTIGPIEAGIVPALEDRFEQETGLGMGETLNVASEKGGYTLADRATYLALVKGRRLALEIVLEKEPLLLNVYHVIEVPQARWPKVNGAGARAFADFMVAPKTQEAIGRFGVEKFGAPLFVPDAGKDPKALGL
jgi:tungstate transport system substrate-binding protein